MLHATWEEKQGEFAVSEKSRGRSKTAHDISEEDALRAQCYRLLAGLLTAAPEQATLDRLAGIAGDDTGLGQALSTLGHTARGAAPVVVADEYQDLFIGVGRGELLPYGSYYLTGFIYEKPLARLRQDMARLGIARDDGIKEPEDHIAALCEMMAGLIEGKFGVPLDLAAQRAFFDAHIGPWAGKFFTDLEAAKAAAFYMPVGAIGRLFMEIESTAFEMAA